MDSAEDLPSTYDSGLTDSLYAIAQETLVGQLLKTGGSAPVFESAMAVQAVEEVKRTIGERLDIASFITGGCAGSVSEALERISTYASRMNIDTAMFDTSLPSIKSAAQRNQLVEYGNKIVACPGGTITMRTIFRVSSLVSRPVQPIMDTISKMLLAYKMFEDFRCPAPTDFGSAQKAYESVTAKCFPSVRDRKICQLHARPLERCRDEHAALAEFAESLVRNPEFPLFRANSTIIIEAGEGPNMMISTAEPDYSAVKFAAKVAPVLRAAGAYARSIEYNATDNVYTVSIIGLDGNIDLRTITAAMLEEPALPAPN
jgi:hypothetical protein